MKKRLNLPLEYSIMPSFDEERFLKMRVKVMHNGLNRNNSSFDNDSIEKAKNTIANIPMLAFVKKGEKDGEGGADDDFAGHEFEITLTREGDIKETYLGRPVGIIPETNNYSYEEDEDGRKFVFVDAYIWKSYANSALDIIERDGMKKVSMEILVDDGEFESEIFHIRDYKYTGVALLGDNVQEGMLGAKAEMAKFSKSVFTDMASELKEALKGGEDMTDKEKEKFVAKEEFTKLQAENETLKKEKEEAQASVDTFKAENDTFKAENETLKTENEELKASNEEFEALKAENETLKTENEKWKKYQDELQETAKKEAVESIINQFTDLEGVEEFEALKKEENYDLKLSDLETKLYAIRGRNIKANFAKDDNGDEGDEGKEKDWKKLLYRHKESGSGEPSWLSIVEKHTKK